GVRLAAADLPSVRLRRGSRRRDDPEVHRFRDGDRRQGELLPAVLGGRGDGAGGGRGHRRAEAPPPPPLPDDPSSEPVVMADTGQRRRLIRARRRFRSPRTGHGGTVNFNATVRPTNHLAIDLLASRRWLDVDNGTGSESRLFTAKVE